MLRLLSINKKNYAIESGNTARPVKLRTNAGVKRKRGPKMRFQLYNLEFIEWVHQEAVDKYIPSKK